MSLGLRSGTSLGKTRLSLPPTVRLFQIINTSPNVFGYGILRRDGQGDAYNPPVMALKKRPGIDAGVEAGKGEAGVFNRSETDKGSNESFN